MSKSDRPYDHSPYALLRDRNLGWRIRPGDILPDGTFLKYKSGCSLCDSCFQCSKRDCVCDSNNEYKVRRKLEKVTNQAV